jgi:hypothetical protein
MNFRLAYKPRGRLQTVNQLGRGNGAEKWRGRSKEILAADETWRESHRDSIHQPGHGRLRPGRRATPPDAAAISTGHLAKLLERLAKLLDDLAILPDGLAKPTDHLAKLLDDLAILPDRLAKRTGHLAILTDDLAILLDDPAPATLAPPLPPDHPYK